MEIFINELSLCGQFHEQSAFEKAVRELLSIFKAIDNLKWETYKDHQILLERKAIKNEHFNSSFEKIRNKDLKVAFRNIIFNRRNPIDWRNEQKHSTNDLFHCPILNDSVENTVLAEVAERNLQDDSMQRILLNFLESPFGNDTNITVFKNDIAEQNPLQLSCAATKAAFQQWCPSEVIDIEAFLKSSDFQKTNYIVKGAAVYIHHQTRNYWYIDTLHKNHFEVFNAQKKHLGEATLTGEMIPDSADPNKNGKLDL